MWQLRGGFPDVAPVLQVSWKPLRYGDRGDPSPWGPLEYGCLALWLWDTEWAGSSAVLALALGWCRDYFTIWAVKAARLKAGVVAALLCVPACTDRWHTCSCIPVILICPALCLLHVCLLFKKVITADVLVASGVGEWRACLFVWHTSLKVTVDTCLLQLVMSDPQRVV